MRLAGGNMMVEPLLGFGYQSPELLKPLLLTKKFSSRPVSHRLTSSRKVFVTKSSISGADLVGEDIIDIFLKERRLNGDFISKISDELWRGEELKAIDIELNTMAENPQAAVEATEDETHGGFLKLIQTQEWVSGDSIAPSNSKLVSKEWQNDSGKRKRLNLLKYEAIKRELFLLTTGIGAACTGYCLITLSMEAGISYAIGVLFSCLYLQLLYYHVDNLSSESIPQIFMKKRAKKIGIRSDDLQDAFERTFKGSTLALSSPRLVIPAAVYGLWWLSHHTFNNIFDFQLVPALLGIFAYKAAALVQVYRDNEDLRMIFPENEGSNS